jgi:hypothetical protein
MKDEASPAIWLVVGSQDVRSSVRRPSEWQVTLLECPTAQLAPDVEGSRMYKLDLRDWPVTRAVVLDQDGNVVEDTEKAELATVLAAGSNSPLGLLRPAGAGMRLYAHVDSYLEHARFIALPQPESARPAAVSDLLAGIDEHFLKVNNYLCFRVKLLPDVELEHKYTLTGDPDVYALARETLAMAADGGLAGWVVEFREEIQAWDFLNHVYAIEEPESEAGYVSFIPTTDGKHTVKRKIFTVDTDERPELRNRGVDVGGDFEAHIRDVMHLIPAWHASFRRVRYDVSVESIETGNVFGIAYDRSTIIDDAGQRVPGLDELSQCEIEYIYSQSLAPIGFDVVRDDLAQLRVLVSDYFDRRQIENYQTHESKLTYLRNQHAAFR